MSLLELRDMGHCGSFDRKLSNGVWCFVEGKVREEFHERSISGLNQGENSRSDEERWDSGHSWKIKSVVFATGRHNQA